MNILDENVPESQRALLDRMRVAVRQIAVDLGHQGMNDDELIPLLHQLPRPTFFTLDIDFYKRRLCHQKYCLVYLDIKDDLSADFVRRVLRHPQFSTKAKRMDYVIRASPNGLTAWRVRKGRESHFSWP
jgi:hypothetical protein